MAEEKSEFPPKLDFCFGKDIPLPSYDAVFFNQNFHFMAGPVPMSLGVF